MMNFLEPISIFIEVFAWTAFANVFSLLSSFKTLTHIFRNIKKAKIIACFNIGKQRVVKNSLKLFFFCQRMFIFCFRFFNSHDSLRENTQLIKRAASFYLFFAFQ